MAPLFWLRRAYTLFTHQVISCELFPARRYCSSWFQICYGHSTDKNTSLQPDKFRNYWPVLLLSKMIMLFLMNLRMSAHKIGCMTTTALLSIKNGVHLALVREEATTVVLLE